MYTHGARYIHNVHIRSRYMYLTVYVVCTCMYTYIFRQEHFAIVKIIGTVFVQQHNNAGIDFKNLNFHGFVFVYGWGIHRYMIIWMYASSIHDCKDVCIIHTSIHACMHLHTMCASTHTFIRENMHLCMCVYMYEWMWKYAIMDRWMHAAINAFMYGYIYACMNGWIYPSMHLCVCMPFFVHACVSAHCTCVGMSSTKSNPCK